MVDKHLTIRSILIGMLGSAVITASSMYVALRMGALPWPTIFVAVLSMALLKLFGKTNLNEINVTHTAMSAGSMVAGGLAFTLPAAWMLDKNADIGLWEVMIVAFAGMFLGLIFSMLLRKNFIVTNPLPYPIGTVAAETVKAGDEGGSKAKLLFASMGFSVVFTFLRDWVLSTGKSLIPSYWMSKKLLDSNIQVGLWYSPMAAAIGYIIGPLYMGVWFLGAVIGYWLLMPIGVGTGLFADAAAADVFRKTLGMGLMIGTGAGIFIKSIIPKIGQLIAPLFNKENKTVLNKRLLALLPIGLAVIAALLTTMTRLSPLVSVLVILGTWITSSMAAQTTGQTGVNPMEVFGVIILLLIKLILPIGQTEAILIAAIVAAACGLAGDIMNDFKAGHTLNTNPKAQFISELAGGIVGAVVSAVVLFAMYNSFGEFGGANLPAPQAAMVAQMVGGIGNVTAFIIGVVAGVLFYITGLPAITLGIGIYLPVIMSTTAFLGAVVAFITKRLKGKSAKTEEKGMITASGLFGGEGITGVVIAIIKLVTGG